MEIAARSSLRTLHQRTRKGDQAFRGLLFIGAHNSSLTTAAPLLQMVSTFLWTTPYPAVVLDRSKRLVTRVFTYRSMNLQTMAMTPRIRKAYGTK